MQEQRGQRELLEVPLRWRPHGHGAEVGFDESAKLWCVQGARIEVASHSRHVEGFLLKMGAAGQQQRQGNSAQGWNNSHPLRLTER